MIGTPPMRALPQYIRRVVRMMVDRDKKHTDKDWDALQPGSKWGFYVVKSKRRPGIKITIEIVSLLLLLLVPGCKDDTLYCFSDDAMGSILDRCLADTQKCQRNATGCHKGVCP